MMRFVMVAMSDDDVTPPPHTPQVHVGAGGQRQAVQTYMYM